MWCLKFLVLLMYMFAVMLNGDSSQKIRLNKVTNLWPLLEKHEIFQPAAIASDREGNFYVFDDGNKIIHKFSSSFKLLKSFGRKGQGPGEFWHGVGKLILSPDGKLVALENWRKTIHYFDLQGKFLYSFILEEIGVPYDLALDREGNHYFTDRGFYLHREHILIYDRNGKLLEKKLPDEHFITWAEVTKKGTPREQTERIAQLLAQHHRRLAINRDNEIFVGRYDKYILEKYSQNLELLWRREMEFERKFLPRAGFNRRSTMPEALNSIEGEGAIADMQFDTRNNIFVSFGLEHSFEVSENDHLQHRIDVFDNSGNHIARLLGNELPYTPRGYKLDIYKTRLMVLGQDRLLVYNIVYE